MRFDKYEKRGAYHWEWYKENKFDYRDNIDLICNQLPHTGTVLDVGCGDGVLSYKLFEQGLIVTGIDNNEVGIQQAKVMCNQTILGSDFIERQLNRFKIKFLNHNLDLLNRWNKPELSFRAESIYEIDTSIQYDYIICHEVIEHLPQPEKALNIMREITKNFAIISTPDGNHAQKKEYDYNIWKPEEFEELLIRTDWTFEYIHRDEVDMYLKLSKK